MMITAATKHLDNRQATLARQGKSKGTHIATLIRVRSGLRKGGLLYLLFALLTFATAIAQQSQLSPGVVDARTLGSPVDLSPNWLFQVGNNPLYASPTLDDRNWKAINTRRELATYGIPPFRSCWYRLHVQVQPNVRDIALGIENVAGSYELFVNGVRLGAQGPMPAVSNHFEAPVTTYRIPDAIIAAAKGSLVFALHFSIVPPGHIAREPTQPMYSETNVVLSTPRAIAHEASYDFAHREIFNVGPALLYIISGLFLFGLFIALRDHLEYLFLSISAFCAALYTLLQVWTRYRYDDHSHLGYLLTMLLWAVMSVTNLEFVRRLVHRPRSIVINVIQIATLVDVLVDQLYLLGDAGATVALVAHLAMFIAGDTYVLVALTAGWRRGNVDAQLILPPWLLTLAVDVYTLIGFGMRLGHLRFAPPPLPDIPIGSYSITILSIINLIYVGALLVMILLRTVRIAHERAAAANEIAAAQTVQQVLLARVSDPTPGFRVETAYHPASEVGGDFFFVSPGEGNSLIAVVGDVSGKGMLAAMRVSMILGVLRRETSREPAAILHSLNQVLLTQGEMGFTTACCVHLDRNGHYYAANAGHISPYISGHEIQTAPALPLGMMSDQQYETLHGEMRGGERMVLMSDGVVEARSASGELYGFERLSELTQQSAAAIAEAARVFGQEDDITVLTIACGEC